MKLIKNIYAYPEKGMLDANTYVIKDKTTVLIDIGLNDYLPAKIKDMEKDGIDITKIDIIANTHLHSDHCWANDALKKLSGAKIMLHPLQKAHWKESIVLVSQFFALPEVEFAEDGLFPDGTLTTGEMSFDLIPCPGHSADSICFYERESKALICGDVVFAQNVGRIDLPGGGIEALNRSVESLSKLDIEYLLPGHMGAVNGRQRVKQNFEFIKQFVLFNLEA